MPPQGSNGERVKARTSDALRIGAAFLPALMLTAGVPFANRIEPRIFGVPFLMAWIMLWIVATPFFLWKVEATLRKPASLDGNDRHSS